MDVLLAIFGRYIKHGFTPSPSFNIIPMHLFVNKDIDNVEPERENK